MKNISCQNNKPLIPYRKFNTAFKFQLPSSRTLGFTLQRDLERIKAIERIVG